MMDCENCGGQDVCCSQSVDTSALERQKLRITKEQEEQMRTRGIACPFYNEGRCSVYSKRPRVCIDFNCCRQGQLKGSDTKLTPAVWLAVERHRRTKDGVS